MFITGYASRFHGNLLLRSEALASVVALYAGKVRVACTIQMHDDLKSCCLICVTMGIICVILCFRAVQVPDFFLEINLTSPLFASRKSQVFVQKNSEMTAFFTSECFNWGMGVSDFFPPRMPRIRSLMGTMISGWLFCTTRPQVIESFSIKSANLYRGSSLHLSYAFRVCF